MENYNVFLKLKRKKSAEIGLTSGKKGGKMQDQKKPHL